MAGVSLTRGRSGAGSTFDSFWAGGGDGFVGASLATGSFEATTSDCLFFDAMSVLRISAAVGAGLAGVSLTAGTFAAAAACLFFAALTVLRISSAVGTCWIGWFASTRAVALWQRLAPAWAASQWAAILRRRRDWSRRRRITLVFVFSGVSGLSFGRLGSGGNLCSRRNAGLPTLNLLSRLGLRRGAPAAFQTGPAPTPDRKTMVAPERQEVAERIKRSANAHNDDDEGGDNGGDPPEARSGLVLAAGRRARPRRCPGSPSRDRRHAPWPVGRRRLEHRGDQRTH